MVDTNKVEKDDDDTVSRFRLMDYLELVDSSGCTVRDDKRSGISSRTAGVLERLGIDSETGLRNMVPRKPRQPVALGSLGLGITDWVLAINATLVG